MGFLKNFGAALLKIGEVVTGVGPIFSQFLPKGAAGTLATVEDTFTKIMGTVMTVETFFAALTSKGLTGADKLKAATPLVSQIILQTEGLKGKKVKDLVKYQASVAGITSNIADLLNSFE